MLCGKIPMCLLSMPVQLMLSNLCSISVFDSSWQFYELEREKEEWRRKYVEMFDNHAQMKLKLDELQSYLSELPTVEESLKNVQEISFLWPS